VKRAILVAMTLTASIGAIGYVMQERLLGEEMAAHKKHAEDLTAAAQVKAFPQADQKKGAEYMRSIINVDLLSLSVCQGNHKLFENEPAPNTKSAPAEEGFIDAEGAAECVVELQSALHEVPTTYSGYSAIGPELAWWNGNLLEVDPADYRRLNP
jgi:hypothetical protein